MNGWCYILRIMFSTCIFCGGSLGRNEVVEEFPVGRRLAFDADRGRLWVLCAGCRRWNLSPLEERWEALESLERISRDTRARYSTGEISLVRHPRAWTWSASVAPSCPNTPGAP